MMAGTPIERIAERYGIASGNSAAFAAGLYSRLPKSFRINTLKTTSRSAANRLSSYGIPIENVGWSGHAFVSRDPSVSKTLEHALGHIYMQGLSSMLPVLLLEEELSEDSLILDSCAAPGSKATQMAALMQNKGTIVANDIDRSRLKALKFNAEKAGAANTVITNTDLLRFPKMEFDAVLLDAPCSTEGMVMNSPQSVLRWSEKRIRQCSALQKRMILKAFDLLKENGVLVYSTCTFAPEENEMVVEHLLQSRQAGIEPAKICGLDLSCGLAGWGDEKFGAAIKRAARVWPHLHRMEGFFMAKVRK